jgi:TIR domain
MVFMCSEENNNDFVYDIAFSFACEQREYVSKVYRILKKEYNVKVFYDNDLDVKTKLWGDDLGEVFQKVYGEQSKWCLMFISKEYKEKFWTRHEKRSALSRAIRQKGIYLLPARFDDTEIEGIPSTTGYIDISTIKPEDFSKLVLLKLGIPLKEKEIPLTELPDVRVNVNHIAIVTASKTEHVLGIKISNYDKHTVFLKYPKITLRNRNEHIPVFKNDIFGNFISEIKLEPGNSYEIFTNPSNYFVHTNELDNVVIDDKIGRVFKGNPDELNKAIENWRKSK